MTKSLKRILLVGLALLTCVLLFAACDSNSEPSYEEFPDETQASTTPDSNQNDTPQYTLSVPSTQVQLTESNSFTTVLNITSTYPTSIWYDIEDTEIVECEWGDWNGSQVPLTFVGQNEGSTTVYIYIEENGNRNNALDSITLTVTVSGMDMGSKGLRYEEYGDGYEVSMGDCTESDIIIPATYKGRPVIAIRDFGFSSENGIKSVTIAEGVTTIGENAFWQCENLVSVSIPDSVVNMESQVFNGCKKLTTVNIPDGITEIGEYMFADCESLVKITIPDSVTKIAPDAFNECTSLESVTLPDSLQSIGESAFYCCTTLTEIHLPESLKTIGDHAFYECTGITLLKTGDNLKKIGDSAFSGCRNLTTVILSDSVETIGALAFYECVRLSNLYLGSGLTDIESSAFSSCDRLTHAFYNGTASKWKKVINEGLRCDVYIGEQPVGDIVDIEGKMTKILTLTGAYNGTMYLMAQFKDIANYESISEYRFTIDVYDTEGDIAYTYTYKIAADGTDTLSKLFALPHCANAKGYEVIISQISMVYNDGTAELAFTDYAKTISIGTELTNVDESKIVTPDHSTGYN